MATTIVKTWNADENFWSLNPMMKTVGVFREFHDKDKTRGKKESSKIMWAIAILVDPNEANIYRNLNYTDRSKIVAEDYLRDPEFNWEHPDIKELREAYEKFCITPAERQLLNFEKKMAEREEFIMKTPYSLDSMGEDNKLVKGTATQLDKMMVESDKIFSRLEDLKDKVQKEADAGAMRGGAQESASESGQL